MTSLKFQECHKQGKLGIVGGNYKLQVGNIVRTSLKFLFVVSLALVYDMINRMSPKFLDPLYRVFIN